MGWDDEFYVYLVGVVVDYVYYLVFVQVYYLGDGVYEFFWGINGDVFERFVQFVVNGFGDDLWFVNGEFEFFVVYLFDEDGQL